MKKNDSVRDKIIRTLLAVSSSKESRFYAHIFQKIDPARFALLVVDHRCLQKPLLEAFASDLKILSDLGLTPILKIGTMATNSPNVSAQTQRLCKQLEASKISYRRLNCATYQLINEIKRFTHLGNMVILEDTGLHGSKDLCSLANSLKPEKIIFVQPSGGLRRNGSRISSLNIDDKQSFPPKSTMSVGQLRSIEMAQYLMSKTSHNMTIVIVSPLNLLAELFTVEGAGTMLRRAAEIKCSKTIAKRVRSKLKLSIESAFGRKLNPDFLSRTFAYICLEKNYRGGAMVSELAGLPYLSKFWVTPEAQGEGIASDIWQSLLANEPVLFWRSRKNNPFNDWYMQKCEGMQAKGEWRVFWIGLEAPEIPGAVLAASNAPQDFE